MSGKNININYKYIWRNKGLQMSITWERRLWRKTDEYIPHNEIYIYIYSLTTNDDIGNSCARCLVFPACLFEGGGGHLQIDICGSFAVPVIGSSGRYYLLMTKGVTRQWFTCMPDERPEPITTRLLDNPWPQIINVVSLGSEGSQLLNLCLVYSLNTPRAVRLVRNRAREPVPRI